jgi:hypothetical protein
MENNSHVNNGVLSPTPFHKRLYAIALSHWEYNIVVTYEIRVFFEGAQKEVFSSILNFENVNT